MFIDIHCHLDHCKTKITQIIKRAKKAEVRIIISNGTNPEANRKILELSEKFNIIKSALGIYPLEALEMSEAEINKEINFIRSQKEKIIAIGEVGMDFKENKETEKQKSNFKKFIKLAKELNKPIIVHSRKAEKECINLLENSNYKKIIMHCFSGRKSLIEKIKENKWFVSIPASIKYNAQFQLLAEKMPLDLILCETDSPFLHPDRKGENEPANVTESYKKIAEIKQINSKQVEKKIENNFRELFEEKNLTSSNNNGFPISYLTPNNKKIKNRKK